MTVIYKDSVGVRLELTISDDVDLTGSTISSVLRKPDGSAISRTPDISGLPLVFYDTIRGDLDQVGHYAWCIIVDYLGTNKSYQAEPLFFRVNRPGRAG